jgi:hypothetical protein
MSEKRFQRYLGDGVYADKDERGWVWIYTSDGINSSSKICLDPDVLSSLVEFYQEK